MQIEHYWHDPAALEKCYRDNKVAFTQAFREVYPQHVGEPLAEAWRARLDYHAPAVSWGSNRELLWLLGAIGVAGFFIKIPEIFHFDGELDQFYGRNLAFYFLPLLCVYFLIKNQASKGLSIRVGLMILAATVYINLLPRNGGADTFNLACIHMLLFMWSVLGVAYVSTPLGNLERRVDFLRYNGELVVMSTLIMIAGGLMSGLTVNLFMLIGFNILEDYMKHIAMIGAVSVPIVATFITNKNPQLVDKVSPVIARIFSPLVLITLSVFLATSFFARKDPFNDRDFLLTVNVVLISVMAIIFFSVAELRRNPGGRIGTVILLLLSVVTIVANAVALSAILFRLSDMGITPNRMAVLGANILFMINLLMVCGRLFRAVRSRDDIREVDKAISVFLPVYAAWTVVVVFLFPVMFGFK